MGVVRDDRKVAGFGGIVAEDLAGIMSWNSGATWKKSSVVGASWHSGSEKTLVRTSVEVIYEKTPATLAKPAFLTNCEDFAWYIHPPLQKRALNVVGLHHQLFALRDCFGSAPYYFFISFVELIF